MEIIVSIILSVFQSILFYGKNIGISMLLFTLIGDSMIFYILYKKKKIYNKNGFLLMIPILLLSATYLIFSNKTFYVANIFILAVLNLVMYVVLTSKKDYFVNYIHNTSKLLSNLITEFKEGINYNKETTKKYIKKHSNLNVNKFRRIVISLLIVSAVVGVVLILLASADMIFANIFSGMVDLFKRTNIRTISSIILRFAIIVITYFLVLNLILKLQKEYNMGEAELRNNKSQNSFTIKLLLIALNIVYFVFCFIQIKSLFAKINIDNVYNYVNYARNGFFQLMFVSLINFVVILISNKYNEKIIKRLNLLLVIFTTIIAVSSMYRIHLYQMEYGLTYLRAFVYIILVTEMISFIPVIGYIFNEKFDFIKWCFIIAISSYCIANYMNIENIIIKKNISLKNTRTIDYEYISNIASDDSYTILENRLLYEDITATEKLDILNILQGLAANKNNSCWQEFNISKYKIKRRDNSIHKFDEQRLIIENEIKEEEKKAQDLARQVESIVYNESVQKDETYLVNQLDSAMGTAVWEIKKSTDSGKNYTTMNTIEVSTPSKIKFFKNGLGFIERPTNIYCGKSELLVTHDSGKTFDVINFPDGVFTLSDPNRTRLDRLL